MTNLDVERSKSTTQLRWRGAARACMLVMAGLFALALVLVLIDYIGDRQLLLSGVVFNVVIFAALAGLLGLGGRLLRRGLLRGYVVGGLVPVLLTLASVGPMLVGKARAPQGLAETIWFAALATAAAVIVVAGIVDTAARSRTGRGQVAGG